MIKFVLSLGMDTTRGVRRKQNSVHKDTHENA